MSKGKGLMRTARQTFALTFYDFSRQSALLFTMKKCLSLIALIMVLVLPGQAQETLISDSIVYPPVFSGFIGYHIEYSGKLSHDQKKWLPDSMMVIVKYPVVRIKYFGGMAPQMLNDIYWNCEDGNYLLLDHPRKVAYTPQSGYKQPGARTMRPDGKQIIQEVPCLTYNITSAGEKLRVWASDSTFFPINFQDSVPQIRPVFFAASLASIPLKMERNQAGISTTTTATQVVRATLPDDEFHVPSGYRRESFEGRMSRHPYIGK